MSDLIDDLLNYELGDVDDQELAADEDELLLSDEESPTTKVSEKQATILLDESEEWVSLELAKASVKENKKVENSSNEKTKVIHINKKPQITNPLNEGNIDSSSTEVTTTEIITEQKVLVSKPKLNRAALKKNLIKSDEVTSSVQDTTEEKQLKEEIIVTPILEETSETCASEIEEDADERNERLNPKTAVERDFISDSIELGGPRASNRGYPRGARGHRGGRHFGPRGGQMYGQTRQQFPLHQGNDMFNNPHPYHSVPGQMMGPPQNTMYNSEHPPSGPRMEYRGPPLPNFRPHPTDMRLQGPPHLHQHPSMGPRPNDFNQMRIPNQPHDGGVRQSFRPFNPNIRGQHHPRFDQMRPRLPGPHTQFINQSQQPQSFMGSQHPGSLMVVRTNDHHLAGMHQTLPSIGIPSQQPVLPRKILINPNFKRGVEAAKNQLMMDNLQFIGHHGGGQQQMQQNDEELLRQQEAFINQNRMHIEKRRHERSPERERDYTPPRRDRRPYSREREHGARNSFRGRTRRDGFDSKLQPKRRRSESLERDNYGMDKEKTEEEDEETRVYRLEIEKQKAMREKILREKEERRKRAAEEKSKDPITEKKTVPPVDTDAIQKLTPIVVKQSKIISLKKKTSTQEIIQKTIPTAKILPETKKTQEYRDTTMAVVKPVFKNKPSAFIIKNITDDESDLDEDALLADSPPPPPPPQQQQQHHHHHHHHQQQQQSQQHQQPTLPVDTSFRGRRVVLKPATNFQKGTNTHKTLSSSDEKHKGIFDRLEKKISVNDASKRTIQRIVLNNSE